MIKTITRESIDEELFTEIISDGYEEINVKHRKNSNYFCNLIYEVNEEYFPNNPELWGFWMSNTIVNDHTYGLDRTEIEELTRCEKRQKVITTEEWVCV